MKLHGALSLAVCLIASVAATQFTTGCAGDRYSRSTGQTLDDSAITAKVKSKMLADSQVEGLDVKVDTFRGEVQLTGFVDTYRQKQRAEQLARQVEGVRTVRNDIAVKMPEPAGAQPKY